VEKSRKFPKKLKKLGYAREKRMDFTNYLITLVIEALDFPDNKSNGAKLRQW
jgi:hypothetical protein